MKTGGVALALVLIAAASIKTRIPQTNLLRLIRFCREASEASSPTICVAS
jgi:hypothetical protein